MADLFGNIANFVFVLIGVVIIMGVITRACSNYFSEEKEVKATVIDKQSYDKQIYRKKSGNFHKKINIYYFASECSEFLQY